MSQTLTDYDADVVLRDGSTVHVRRLRSTDIHALLDFFERLSPESRYFRFFTQPKLDEEMVRRLAAGEDDDCSCGLVAESAGTIVGVAQYYRENDPARAEAAFAIADAYQGRGMGTRLLERLADAARDHGIGAFHAYVLGENRKMLDVFLESGFTTERRIDSGVFHVVLSLAESPEFLERAAGRAQAAATASMKAFFEPRVVAVVGANRERGRIGSEILNNLVTGGFTGRIVPVHPTAREVLGPRAYRRVSDIPDPADLAVIVVPAREVEAVVDQCMAKRVKALVIISAGFAEVGGEGRDRELALVEKIRSAGIRLIGPNCMGIVNTDPSVRLNATFSPVCPPDGRVAMSTQSGALGLAILSYVSQVNLGISTFVSIGNKADVSGNDLIQYWAQDPRTDVILLYLESFGNPRKFGQIARRVARTKPIVAVKAGRSRAGARAASSHTGALASSDATVDALFRQSGVIRTGTLEEMFDVASLVASQPLPCGPRVAILTNAGGPGILAADACEAQGLELPPLGETTVRELQSLLPPAASVGNPVDMLASASADQYRRAMELLLADDHVDSLLAIFIPPLVTEAAAVAAAIVEGAKTAKAKPVLACFMSAKGAPSSLAPVPSYMFPESAATALAKASAYAAWRIRPAGSVPQFADLRPDEARQIVSRTLDRGGGWLAPLEAHSLVAAAGIPVTRSDTATNEPDVIVAATRIGFPVALKAVGPAIVHKTEVGGVRLNLRTEDDVRTAYCELGGRLGPAMTSVLVQQMAPDGIEMLIGATEDPMFGPLVACGSGGILVDVLRDTTFRMAPLTDVDATDMLNETRVGALLRGVRGQPPGDDAAVREALLRISALLESCPGILEMDLNPVRVFARGLLALDVRVRVGHRTPSPPSRRISY